MPHVIESPTPAPHLPRCQRLQLPLPSSSLLERGHGLQHGVHCSGPARPGVHRRCDGPTVTRHEVGEQGRKLAGGLRKLGLKQGDVGCIYGLNSLEWVNALNGCQALR